jgi:uncharacterized protein (DUF4213/DUF364 family)
MSFKGVRNENGRPKGVSNKVTTEVKEAFLKLVHDNLEQLQKDIQKLEPGQRVKMILELARFVVPRLKDVEHKFEVNNFEPIVINWTNGKD